MRVRDGMSGEAGGIGGGRECRITRNELETAGCERRKGDN